MTHKILIPATLILFALFGIPSAIAQVTIPDAGSMVRDLPLSPETSRHRVDVLPVENFRPPPRFDDNTLIEVREIRISGATAFPLAELQALIADAINRKVSLNQIELSAQRLTKHYRERGYLLARAYIPAQEIRDGVVEIAIVEGRLGKLGIDNHSAMADAQVSAYFRKLQSGEAVNSSVLEQGLLLLSDLPGIEVRSTLKPGASVGTTDLDVQVSDKSPYAGSLELDNFGNRFSGDWRGGASFSVGNLAGFSDTLSLRLVGSEGMHYGRVAWQLPVGQMGTQVGTAWSEMDYKLGQDFSNLNAHGKARIGSLYLLHPFARGRAVNIHGQLVYDHKQLDDEIGSTTSHSRKSIDVINIGTSGDRGDGFLRGGVSTWSLAYGAGQLTLDGDMQNLDKAGHQTAGRYWKLVINGSRTQRLDDDWSVYTGVRTQISGKNLDSSEKMSLGGAQGVRAYPQGEAPADDAVLATVELRRNLFANWQASLFYDSASARINHSPIAADTNNVRRLAGVGFGIATTLSDFYMQLTVAWRDASRPTSDVDRSPRVWFQGIKRF